jgi:hypothetical protein
MDTKIMVLLASKILIFMAKDAAALRLMWRVVINVQLATRTMDALVEKMLKCILKKTINELLALR